MIKSGGMYGRFGFLSSISEGESIPELVPAPANSAQFQETGPFPRHMKDAMQTSFAHVDVVDTLGASAPFIILGV